MAGKCEHVRLISLSESPRSIFQTAYLLGMNVFCVFYSTLCSKYGSGPRKRGIFRNSRKRSYRNTNRRTRYKHIARTSTRFYLITIHLCGISLSVAFQYAVRRRACRYNRLDIFVGGKCTEKRNHNEINIICSAPYFPVRIHYSFRN